MFVFLHRVERFVPQTAPPFFLGGQSDKKLVGSPFARVEELNATNSKSFDKEENQASKITFPKNLRVPKVVLGFKKKNRPGTRDHQRGYSLGDPNKKKQTGFLP